MSDILSASNLSSLPSVRHAFFTRAYGNGGFSGQDSPQDALPVRARMAAHFGVVPQNFLCVHQIHSPDVAIVNEIWDPFHNPRADALVTDKKNIVLGVLTADCVPVLFAAEDMPIIGAAHAGWRGALGGVLENTIKAMESLGTKRQRIHAALGPCIAQASYEVGPEFPAPFIAEDEANHRFFRPSRRDTYYMFDLPGYVVAKLKKLGLVSVEGTPADTCADPVRFYSHRYSTLKNEKREGNLMSAIMLLP